MKVGRTSEDQQKQAALSLLKRLPPQDIAQNLDSFARIAPNLEQSLAPHVSRPLQVKQDGESNRYFIACEYNCDGGTHRSPWSNKYFPPPGSAAEELFRPSERLRRLEETFNEVFDAYKTSYYDGGVSSVYLWDLDEGFAGAFLIHKEAVPGDRGGLELGTWDSVHVVEVKEPTNSNSCVDYKLSSSVLLHAKVASREPGPKGDTEFSSFVTRQAEDRGQRRKTGEDSHLLHIGRMLEEMEINIRQSMDVVHMAKQREVLNAVHSLDSSELLGLPAADTPKKKQMSKGSESTRKIATIDKPEAKSSWAAQAAATLKAESNKFASVREEAMGQVYGTVKRETVTELHLPGELEARLNERGTEAKQDMQASKEDAERLAKEEAELAAEMEKYSKMQLKVKIEYAENLRAANQITGKGVPNAFCLVRCRSTPELFWGSDAVSSDANPRWSCELFIRAKMEDALEFIVLDKGKSEDKFIGQAALDCDVIFPNGKTAFLPLTDRWEGDSGDMKVNVTVIDYQDASFQDSKPWSGGVKRLPGRIFPKTTERESEGPTQLSANSSSAGRPIAADGRPKQLKVTVISARNLKNVDNALLGQGVSDPYCIVRFQGKPDSEWSTQVIEDNLNPDWNCCIRLPGFEQGDNLEFVVMDKDRFNDDFIGEVSLPCTNFHPNGWEGTLLLREGLDGEINVKVEWV